MSEPTKRVGKRSAETAEKTKRAILDAATSLFVDKGFDATSLREVAKKANLTHSIIHYHFGSKLEIWNAIVEAALTSYTEKMIPILLSAALSEDVLDAFKRVVITFIKVTSENPELTRLMAREGVVRNERSESFYQKLELMHEQIGPLFKRAKQESPTLAKYTNNSFFRALLSLTTYPLIVPLVSEMLPITSRPDEDQVKAQEALILNILFD